MYFLCNVMASKMNTYVYFISYSKQMKVKGSFKNLVRGAKKGAASGMKFKARRGKKQ